MARPKGDEELVRTAITLPVEMHREIEDEARANKHLSWEPKSVSALIRQAIEVRRAAAKAGILDELLAKKNGDRSDGEER
jgi:hypothetical protein